jgi:hypothetical protein
MTDDAARKRRPSLVLALAVGRDIDAHQLARAEGFLRRLAASLAAP